MPSLHLAEVTLQEELGTKTLWQRSLCKTVNPSRSQSQPATEPKSTLHQSNVLPFMETVPPSHQGEHLHGDDASSHEDEANLTPCERQASHHGSGTLTR
ncbi:MAG: hypothetical protein U0176_15280 [Bacteroidia bacterium]